MALNPAIDRVRNLSAKKIAGVHSLTLGELVAFGFLVSTILPQLSKRVPFVKGHTNTCMYAALALLFIVLWID
jgi:hypothetical protein